MNIPSAQTLSAVDCRPFIIFFRDSIQTLGLMELLDTFSQKNRSDLGIAVRSWHDNMREGEPIVAALENMKPRFCPALEEVLSLGAVQGIIHIVLDDLCAVYDGASEEEDLLATIHRLAETIVGSKPTEGICEACFQRDFSKVLERVKLEGAREVILEQEGELFFHQWFVAAKVLHYIEPCHSRVYQSIKDRLAMTAGENAPIVLGDAIWTVRAEGEGQYKLHCGDEAVLITLRAHPGDTDLGPSVVA